MKNKIILKDRITATIRCQRGRTIETAVSVDTGCIETDNIRMQVQTEKSEDSLLGTLELSIHTNTLEESCLLEKDRPIRIALPLTERPEKITALYMFNPWWTRPAFPASCAEIPDKTQIALLKFTDRIVCLVPMVGDRMKTMLCPGDDEQSLCMEMTAYVGGIICPAVGDKGNPAQGEPTDSGDVPLPRLVQLGCLPNGYLSRGRPRKGCRAR